MDCRLCLSRVSPESAFSIFDDSHPLEHHIWSSCHLRVLSHDRLPKSICVSCESAVKLLSDFKSTCIRNDKMSRHKLNDSTDLKVEEVILEDLNWENEPSTVPQLQTKKKTRKTKPHSKRKQQPRILPSFETINVDDHLPKLLVTPQNNVESTLDHQVNTLTSTRIAAAAFILIFYILKMKKT